MAAQKGKDLLIKIAQRRPSSSRWRGCAAGCIAFNAETVDITHAEPPTAGAIAGRRGGRAPRLDLRPSGCAPLGRFARAGRASVRQAFFDGAISNCRVLVPDFGTITGLFQIASLEFAGEHNGEVSFDLALESAGALTFAAV